VTGIAADIRVRKMLVPAAYVLAQVDVDRLAGVSLYVRLEENLIPDAIFIQVVHLVINGMPIRLGTQLVATL